MIFWAGTLHCCKCPNYDFCISQGSVATLLRLGGQSYAHLCHVSSLCYVPKIIKSASVPRSYSQNNTGTVFFGDTVYIIFSLTKFPMQYNRPSQQQLGLSLHATNIRIQQKSLAVQYWTPVINTIAMTGTAKHRIKWTLTDVPVEYCVKLESASLNMNGCILFQNLTNLNPSRFVRQDRSSPVKKNTHIFLVVVGVVIWFLSAQNAADHALIQVNRLRRRPAAQMGVAKSDFLRCVGADQMWLRTWSFRSDRSRFVRFWKRKQPICATCVSHWALMWALAKTASTCIHQVNISTRWTRKHNSLHWWQIYK